MTTDSPQAIARLNQVLQVLGFDPITTVFGTPVYALDTPIPSYIYNSKLALAGIVERPYVLSLQEILDEYNFVAGGRNGTTSDDFLDGTTGADRIVARSGDDIVDGADGDDVIIGGGGRDALGGNSGDDSINAGTGNDYANGGAGNDTVFGGGGRDELLGGSGNDFLFGQGGADRIRGGDGNDSISGGNSHDSLMGGAGNDTLLGDNGRDTLNGDGGDDLLLGGAGADQLFGGGGNNRMFGGSGNDNLVSGPRNGVENFGTSIMDGGTGSDVLRSNSEDGAVFLGNVGNDRNIGGAGDDIFVFRDGDDRDVVQNFGVGQTTTSLYSFNAPDVSFSQAEGFDTLVIDKDGYDSFDDIEDLIRVTNDGKTIINFGDGDRLTFINESIFGGSVLGLPGGNTGSNLSAENVIFGSSDDFIV